MARFIVFGVKPEDGLFVEIHTDEFQHAIELRGIMSVDGEYVARIWDCAQRGFVSQKTINYAELFFG